MKAFKYILTGVAMATMATTGSMLTSCSDLDEKPYTFVDPNSYYKTETELQTALTGTYNRFRRIYSGNNALYLAEIEMLTEQGWPTYNKDNMHEFSTWTYANSATVGGVMKIWSMAYECINRANIVIARADGISMSDEARNRIKGQALFLRGYTYFHLLRCFGGVPLTTTYTNGVEGLDIPRASVEDTYQRVIDDLKDAEEYLPVRGTSGYEVWRASKGSAQAALGEVYLYKATMNDNNREDLQKAKEYSYKVIESRIYDLMPEFTDNFYWFNENAKNCMESVFELQYSEQAGQSNCMHIRFGLGRTNSAYMGCYQYARFGVSGLLYKEMVENGDKRANAMLSYFEGLCGNDNKALVSQPCRYNVNTLSWEPKAWNDRPAEMRAVFNCKYFDNRTDYTLQAPNANFPILRYSEVLLNYAEAANLLQAGDGITELNMVRNRAGLASLPTGTSQADIDNDILNQRRYEFVGEGKVFFDELRKDKLADFATEKCHKTKELGITYMSDEIIFKPKKTYLFMIPQGDLDSNKALHDAQNPENVSK